MKAATVKEKRYTKSVDRPRGGSVARLAVYRGLRVPRRTRTTVSTTNMAMTMRMSRVIPMRYT